METRAEEAGWGGADVDVEVRERTRASEKEEVAEGLLPRADGAICAAGELMNLRDNTADTA